MYIYFLSCLTLGTPGTKVSLIYFETQHSPLPSFSCVYFNYPLKQLKEVSLYLFIWQQDDVLKSWSPFAVRWLWSNSITLSCFCRNLAVCCHMYWYVFLFIYLFIFFLILHITTAAPETIQRSDVHYNTHCSFWENHLSFNALLPNLLLWKFT